MRRKIDVVALRAEPMERRLFFLIQERNRTRREIDESGHPYKEEHPLLSHLDSLKEEISLALDEASAEQLRSLLRTIYVHAR